MNRLIIRNVGPVKSVDLRLNKVNMFIGPQGSGKSTIAKILSFCSWLEKVNDATDNVSVHIRKKGSYIRELLVVNNGHDDCMMVMVKGKIHEKDINRLLLEDIVKKTYTHKK